MSYRLIPCIALFALSAHSHAYSAGNPASAYCEKVSGVNLTVESDKGQMEVCLLPDGSAIESWSLFRSEPTKQKASVPAPEAVPEDCNPDTNTVSWLNMRDCLAKDAAASHTEYTTAHSALNDTITDAALVSRMDQVDRRFQAWREAQCRLTEEIATGRDAPQGAAYYDCLSGIDDAQAELLKQMADQ